MIINGFIISSLKNTRGMYEVRHAQSDALVCVVKSYRAALRYVQG